MTLKQTFCECKKILATGFIFWINDGSIQKVKFYSMIVLHNEIKTRDKFKNFNVKNSSFSILFLILFSLLSLIIMLFISHKPIEATCTRCDAKNILNSIITFKSSIFR